MCLTVTNTWLIKTLGNKKRPKQRAKYKRNVSVVKEGWSGACRKWLAQAVLDMFHNDWFIHKSFNCTIWDCYSHGDTGASDVFCKIFLDQPNSRSSSPLPGCFEVGLYVCFLTDNSDPHQGADPGSLFVTFSNTARRHIFAIFFNS